MNKVIFVKVLTLLTEVDVLGGVVACVHTVRATVSTVLNDDSVVEVKTTFGISLNEGSSGHTLFRLDHRSFSIRCIFSTLIYSKDPQSHLSTST